MITVFQDACVFDGFAADILEGAQVVVEGDRIREVSRRPTKFQDARVVNCKGRYLIPGLIDAHFHAYSPTFDAFRDDQLPPSLMACHAAKILSGALSRGFTTVRDAGGGDVGLAIALEKGLIVGPRFFYSGKALSQTGGHGDFRPGDHHDLCGCSGYMGTMSVVVDGVDAVRAAAREELRKGAHQIKLFVSGGVLSPTDPMRMEQFTDDEIKAAVREAGTRSTYVMAHCHTDEGANRCAALGVRTIEHGTLINRVETAEFIRRQNAYVVPTLAVVEVLSRHSNDLRLPPFMLDKLIGIKEIMHSSIKVCMRAGVKLGLGTDLSDHRFHSEQGIEFALRGESSSPLEVLRSATSINAEILQKTGELGCIAAGAYADMLVLDGDPFKDLTLFARPMSSMPVVMKAGEFIRGGSQL